MHGSCGSGSGVEADGRHAHDELRPEMMTETPSARAARVCVCVCACVCMCVYVCLGGLRCLLACLKIQRTQLMARLFAATPSIRRASAGCWKGTWRAPLWHHGVQSRLTSARRERAVGTGSRCWECSQGSARRSLSKRVHSRSPTRSLHHKPRTHTQTLVSLGIPRQKTRLRPRWRNRMALAIPAAGRPANKHPSSATDVSARVVAREGRRSGGGEGIQQRCQLGLFGFLGGRHMFGSGVAGVEASRKNEG